MHGMVKARPPVLMSHVVLAPSVSCAPLIPAAPGRLNALAEQACPFCVAAWAESWSLEPLFGGCSCLKRKTRLDLHNMGLPKQGFEWILQGMFCQKL